MSNLRTKFSKLYEQNVDRIYRFIYIKVSSQEVAEDLTSEVFTRGWQAYNNKDRDIDNMTAFLYQIARNLVVDHYRERGRAQLVSVENAPQIMNPGPDLEETAAVNSDFYRVQNALSDLKDDYREVIVWYYLDELSIREISKILNKSEEAVRVQVHRALNALRTKLPE